MALFMLTARFTFSHSTFCCIYGHGINALNMRWKKWVDWRLLSMKEALFMKVNHSYSKLICRFSKIDKISLIADLHQWHKSEISLPIFEIQKKVRSTTEIKLSIRQFDCVCSTFEVEFDGNWICGCLGSKKMSVIEVQKYFWCRILLS